MAGDRALTSGDVLRLCIDTRQDFTQLLPWQQKAAVRAQSSLNAMVTRGHLDLRQCKRMFEFGAGTGGASFVLARLALLNGGTVEVAELEPEHADHIVQSQILPPESVHVGDGVNRLRQLARVGKKFDLLAAFMFGPDYFGHNIKRLLPAAGEALDNGGKLLVSSDPQTMEAVRTVCSDRGIEFGNYHPFIEQGFHSKQPDRVDTVVIPHSNLPF